MQLCLCPLVLHSYDLNGRFVPSTNHQGQAKHYELCIELYTLLVTAMKQTRNYTRLIDILLEFKMLTDITVQAVSNGT